MFKQKLHLPKSTPNALLFNNLIHSYRDLYETLLQAHYSNFLIQINNNNMMGITTSIRLRQIQLKEWLPKSPLLC